MSVFRSRTLLNCIDKRMLCPMAIDRETLIERAKRAARESKFLDFKREFDPASPGACCELVKDIVAFANSGGGIIVFGVADDGSPSRFNPAALLKFDAANFTTQIAKYTGHQFADVEVVEIDRTGHRCAALIVGSSNIPLVFTRPGTYEITPAGGKQQQKTAFSVGTVYFRHNSKSEPRNRDDLIAWRDAEIERHRKAWLGGIRKVVATSAHETVKVGTAELDVAIGRGVGVRKVTSCQSSPGVDFKRGYLGRPRHAPTHRDKLQPRVNRAGFARNLQLRPNRLYNCSILLKRGHLSSAAWSANASCPNSFAMRASFIFAPNSLRPAHPDKTSPK